MPCSVADRIAALAQVMHVLSEHFGRDQRHAAVGDEETLAVLRWIDTGLEPCRKRAVPVDDALPEHDIAMHLDIGQDYRVLDVAIAVHVNIREQQRTSYRRAADDASVRQHLVERSAGR